MRSRIVVVGAYGRAGRAIAARLAAARLPVVLAGRDANALAEVARLSGCPWVSNDTDDAWHRIAAGAFAVVNCAGPFADSALPIATACVENGAHYLDISGERRSVAALDGLHARAVAAGCGVIPACGAKGALGTWAAGCLPNRDPLEIAYAHEGRAYWSPTASALLSVAGEGVEWEAQRPLDHGPGPRVFRFPPPFGSGLAVHVSGTEEVTVAGGVRCYVAVDPGTARNIPWGLTHHALLAPLTRPAAPALWRAMLALGRDGLRRRLPPAEAGHMAVVVERGSERMGIVVKDGYAATAATVALCVEALMGGPRKTGVLSVADLVPPHVALRALAERGEARCFRGGRSR
jgi:hypothetical protein